MMHVESHDNHKMASFHVYRERRVELEALLQEMKVNRKKADHQEEAAVAVVTEGRGGDEGCFARL